MTKPLKETEYYWVDEKQNKWNKSKYTKEQAEKGSESLINCTNCIDCFNCYSCDSCYFCYSCNYCNSCDYCNSCNSCDYCDYCYSCDDCKDFKKNPQRIVSDLIGTRKSSTTVYWVGDNIKVVTGCFQGDLNDLKEAVEKKHKDTQYYNEYMKFINNVEKYMEMCND